MGGKKEAEEQQQNICQKLEPFVSPRQGSTQGKNESSSVGSTDRSFIFFSLEIFKSNTGTAFACKPPYGLAVRLGMGLRSVSCCAFVIKHARTLYRLLTVLITGNYRSAGPVGVPILPKHPVSNVSSGSVHHGCCSAESLCARFGECGHSRAMTKKSDKGFMSSMTHHAFSYGSEVSTMLQKGWRFYLSATSTKS